MGKKALRAASRNLADKLVTHTIYQPNCRRSSPKSVRGATPKYLKIIRNYCAVLLITYIKLTFQEKSGIP